MSEAVIPSCFLVLLLIFLWMLAESKSAWLPKCVVAAIGVFMALQMWFSIDSFRGFDRPATQEQINRKRAIVYWARIDEPTHDDAGQVVLWMRLEDEINPFHWMLEKRESSPQIYSFPYDRDFHQLVADLQAKIVQNDLEPIEVAFDFTKHSQEVSNNGSPADYTHSGGKWVMYELPPAKMPPKVAAPASR
jgi:hypothetical protein